LTGPAARIAPKALEVFEPDDLTAARARFAELTADGPTPG
jgi:hypothetical protein